MSQYQTIWDTFTAKVEDVFVTGYNLPQTLHVSAVQNIETKLEEWKGKINVDVADQSFEVTKDTCDTDLTENVDTSQDVADDGTEALDQRDSAEVDTKGDKNEVAAETNLYDGEEAMEGNEVPADTKSPVTKKKRRQSSKKKNASIRTTPTRPVRSSRRGSDHTSPKAESSEEKSEVSMKLEPEEPTEHPSNGTDDDLMDGTFPKTCPLCFNTYSSRSGYVYHKKKHEEAAFPCKHCNFIGATFPNLRTHLLKCHPNEASLPEFQSKSEKVKEENLFCKECGKKFKSERNLRIHESFHQNGSLKCPECPKEFLSQVGYDNHLRLHTGDNLHKCSQCNYVVGSQSMLATHIRRVHDRVEKYLCDICGKGFITTFRMKRHKEVTHMKDELKDRYHCPHCDHKTHCEASLKTHIKYIHMDNPGYMCNICGITLKYKHSLIDHQRRHSSKKNYQCSECSFRGICAKDVKNHIRRKHQEANEKCDICGKCFKQKGHLERHKVIHTGEKQFSCRLCSYRCNVKGNLRKHMLHVHKMNERQRPVIEKIDVEDKPIPAEDMVAVAVVAADVNEFEPEQTEVEYYNLGNQHNVQTVIMDQSLISNFDQVSHQVEVPMEDQEGLQPMITAILQSNAS